MTSGTSTPAAVARGIGVEAEALRVPLADGTLFPLPVGPADRAGTLAAIYLISYGGAAIPGLIAGQLSRTLSLFDIALGYGALAAPACIVTLVAATEPRPTAAAERPAAA